MSILLSWFIMQHDIYVLWAAAPPRHSLYARSLELLAAQWQASLWEKPHGTLCKVGEGAAHNWKSPLGLPLLYLTTALQAWANLEPCTLSILHPSRVFFSQVGTEWEMKIFISEPNLPSTELLRYIKAECRLLMSCSFQEESSLIGSCWGGSLVFLAVAFWSEFFTLLSWV